MSRMKAASIIFALAALSGFPQGAATAEPANPDSAAAACEELIERLHALEALETATRDEIADYGQKAQRLAAWFGLEEFGAFADALRRQERILAGNIEELRADLRAFRCRIEPPQEQLLIS